MLPTFPKPWMTTRAPDRGIPRWRAVSRATIATPRPVASVRPADPPMLRGFPVTTAGTEYPWCML